MFKLPKWYTILIVVIGTICLALTFIAAAFGNHLLQVAAAFGGAILVTILYLRVELPLQRKKQAAGYTTQLSTRIVLLFIVAGLVLIGCGALIHELNQGAANLAVDLGAALAIGASAALVWQRFNKTTTR